MTAPPPESAAFWSFFNDVAAPRLAHREDTFRQTFQYLDRFPAPITIVETGCVRTRDNWEGDGQSTVLFDRYVSARGAGSHCFSVDISPTNVALCRAIVGENVSVTASDSVTFLNVLTRQFVAQQVKVNLFYLDSFDLDHIYWFPSAAHHLKELVAAWRAIDKETLVMVDDCPQSAQIYRVKDTTHSALPPFVGGKGRLVAEFAHEVGVQPLFSNYQAGWIGF